MTPAHKVAGLHIESLPTGKEKVAPETKGDSPPSPRTTFPQNPSIERGASDPKLSTFTKLAKAFGVSAGELLRAFR